MTGQTSRERAQEYMIASQLAEYGARPKLISTLTELSESYAKKMVRDANGDGCGKRSKKDPTIWFSQDPMRLQHGSRFLMNYYKTEDSQRMAIRLMEAYIEYRFMSEHLVLKDRVALGINEAFDLLQLYYKGEARLTTCSCCGYHIITFESISTCYVCDFLESIVCNTEGCKNILPERQNDEKRGRPKAFCEVCERERATRKRKRKKANGFIMPTSVVHGF